MPRSFIPKLRVFAPYQCAAPAVGITAQTFDVLHKLGPKRIEVLLGLHPSTLRFQIKKLGIERP
jgi:hypothetical protein